MSHLVYLLDTNILSDLIKHPNGLVAQKLMGLKDDTVCCTSIVVASELQYGAIKKGSAKLTERVQQLLDTIKILPLENGVDVSYGFIRSSLEKVGTPIGGNDLFIAAHALFLNLIMVTANEKEFTRVEGLIVENWL